MKTAELLIKSGLATQDVAARIANSLDAACQKFSINTPLRLAGFLSQCSHESCGFTAIVENLNYSAQGLLATWPKKFDAAKAAEYAHHPEKIANYVYGNRMGNGPEESGDGWRFRGRGFIQLTGKDNYTKFDSDIEARGALLINPDAVTMPDLAAMSAGWYWDKHGLNQLADAGDVVAMTKAINGGTMGLEHRQKLYDQVLSVYTVL